MEVALRALLGDIGRFSHAVWPEMELRRYQLPAARAIVSAAAARRGETLCVVMARQSGKDELIAQVLVFLLIRHQFSGGEMVFATPSLVPQGEMSMARVRERLDGARMLHRGMERHGHVLAVGKAAVRYLSAGPGANARGATASLLTIANEAQDIAPERWDAVFDPMGASTNSATVFSGTVWTDDTLLAREMAKAAGVEPRTPAASPDGPRLFLADWQAVAAVVPAYGERVRRRIAERGADDPFVRTEYLLQPLAGGGRLLDAGRLAQMRGEHGRVHAAQAGRTYALLLDVGGGEGVASRVPGAEMGEGSAAFATSGGRDSTVLTVVDVGLDAEADDPEPLTRRAALPVYRVVDRRVWTGTGHPQLAREIGDLARRVWRATHVVVDATGIGHGLAAMLGAALPADCVIPFVFTSVSKSDLGWRLLSAVGAGRYREYEDDGATDTAAFWAQAGAATYRVRPGPARLMQWGVADRELHDDLLLSAALVGALDDRDWSPRLATGHMRD